MKILFLNPKLDAEHNVLRALGRQGFAVLMPQDTVEAWHMLQLHGLSIDIAVIHREILENTSQTAGLELINRIKSDPAHSDLPMILTTESWSNDECIEHQNTQQGVNAYLREPYEPSQMIDTVQLILGRDSSDVQTPLEIPSVIQELSSWQNVPDKELNEEPNAVSNEEPSAEFSEELPYLFKQSGSGAPSLQAFIDPIGNAVVPGGAAQAPDQETLKKYLLYREQDVAVLSTQLKEAQEQIQSLNELLKVERAQSAELNHLVQTQKQKIERSEEEIESAIEGYRQERDELQFQLKVKADKVRLLENQVKGVQEETESLKERVRQDIRKIRVREKELENKLEILKKDTEVLVGAREAKIVELKRQLDLLEFNMDLLQDQYAREREVSADLREKLGRVAQAVRVAGGLLDPNGAKQDAHSESDATQSLASLKTQKVS